ncbi:hypothetical protein VCHA51O444_10390 [Vibrio chagasii]|nr:hypothetical protein VCHA51O444_10390 [Vibrio chagasii]
MVGVGIGFLLGGGIINLIWIATEVFFSLKAWYQEKASAIVHWLFL